MTSVPAGTAAVCACWFGEIGADRWWVRSAADPLAFSVAKNLRFARRDHDMVARHGRFPARSQAVGRSDRPEVAAAIAGSGDW